MGSTTVQAPKPSAQETALLENILNQLSEQQAYNDMLMPDYAHQLHYKIEEVAATPYQFTESEQNIINQYEAGRDEYMEEHGGILGGGISKWNSLVKSYNLLQKKKESYEEQTTQKWTKMSDEEWYNDPQTTDTERRNWDIATETGERQLKALKGELPLTESLQQQKQKEFEQMKATYGITGDLETATAQDTIGTQNLSEFKKRWNALEEQERYGQLSSGTSQNIQATGLASDIANRNIGSLSSLGGQNAGISQGYYSLLNPYMAYTQAGYQASAQNAATQNQMFGSLLGAGAMLGSTALMASAMSSKKYKKDIKTKTKKEEDQALKDILKTRSVEYRYKKEMGLGTKKHIGAIAEEVPKAMATSNRTAINLADKMEYVILGMKALDRKLKKLGAEA